MTQQHSPEPWLVGGSAILCGDGYLVLETQGLNLPNAERIIACINACQGISNEELEAGNRLSFYPPQRELDIVEQLHRMSAKSRAGIIEGIEVAFCTNCGCRQPDDVRDRCQCILGE